MLYETALVIAGPTTTGKTDVAFEVARRTRGEIVNADVYYLFDGFPISSGFSDTQKLHQKTGIPVHLYQVLPHNYAWPDDQDYVVEANPVIRSILQRDVLPIVEGCTFSYVRELVEMGRNRQHSMYCPVVGLEWCDDVDEVSLKAKIGRRLDEMIAEGAVDEVKRDLDRGYRNTRLHWQDVIITPLARYVDSKEPMDLEVVKAEIVQRFYDEAVLQLKLFKQIPGITWIKHDTSNVERTVEQIMGLLG